MKGSVCFLTRNHVYVLEVQHMQRLESKAEIKKELHQISHGMLLKLKR